MNNTTLLLKDFDEENEAVVYPKGFILIKNTEGNTEPRLLTELEPPILKNVLRKLIPEIKASLEDKKHVKENLLEDLIKIRDSFE